MSERFPDREIVHSRTFPHSRSKVFNAFSDPEKLAKWWGPNGFTSTFHSFEFEPGGEWCLTMHGPDGQNYKNECLFNDVIEPSKVVIEHLSAPRFVLEVDLEEAKNGTFLTWVQRFETAEMKDLVIAIVGNANEENLDRLALVLAES